MLKHLKLVFNVQFKINECEDDVFSEDSDEEEDDEQMKDGSESEAEKSIDRKDDQPVAEFPKSFIFSCVGVGLSNIARKTE